MGGSFISQKAKHFCTSDGTVELRAPSPLRIVRWRKAATEEKQRNTEEMKELPPRWCPEPEMRCK